MMLEVEACNKQALIIKQKRREEEAAFELEIAQFNLGKIKSEEARIRAA
jgi:hypothetical protein